MRRHNRCSINEIGRVVIPARIRKQLELREGTPVEIYVDNSGICLKRFQESCVFCKSSESLILFRGHHVCKDCIREVGSRRVVVGIG